MPATKTALGCPDCGSTATSEPDSDGMVDCFNCGAAGGPPLRCLDESDACKGAVVFRMPLSGTGKSFIRCDKHWSDRLDVQAGINRRYPTHAPSDFDPGYAGETWDEEN